MSRNLRECVENVKIDIVALLVPIPCYNRLVRKKEKGTDMKKTYFVTYRNMVTGGAHLKKFEAWTTASAKRKAREIRLRGCALAGTLTAPNGKKYQI